MNNIRKVLFLTRGDASRAQMAEGFLRVLTGNRFIAFSAGTEDASVSPLAIEVMREVGIDISTQKPHELCSLFRETFQYAAVLCDESRERYPIYPFTPKVLRWPVLDPEVAIGGLEARKQIFRLVRDEIRNMVEEFIERMSQTDSAFTMDHAAAA